MTLETPSSTPLPARASIAPTITRITSGILWSSVVGTIISALILHAKYTGKGLCTETEKFNCISVFSNQYTQVAGISIGYIALIVFLVIAIAAWKIRKPPVLGRRGRYSHQQVLKFIAYIAALGTLWALYLAYLEAFVLQSWCLLCLIQQGLIISVLILTLTARSTIAEDMRVHNVCEFC